MNMVSDENKIQIQVIKEINKPIFAAGDYDAKRVFPENDCQSKRENCS